MQLFLSLEHLEAVEGLLIGLISILLCPREQGHSRRGREMGNGFPIPIGMVQWLGGPVRTHTTFTN